MITHCCCYFFRFEVITDLKFGTIIRPVCIDCGKVRKEVARDVQRSRT